MSGAFQPQFHPAGFDSALRVVLDDVRAGRWRSMKALLETCATWGLRTSRSQVLAAAAANGVAVEAWLQEDPHVNAVMMQARVVVERALNAHTVSDSGMWDRWLIVRAGRAGRRREAGLPTPCHGWAYWR